MSSGKKGNWKLRPKSARRSSLIFTNPKGKRLFWNDQAVAHSIIEVVDHQVGLRSRLRAAFYLGASLAASHHFEVSMSLMALFRHIVRA